MNRTKIGWTDYSWSPVTGCLHSCPYCYARRIARRFGCDDKARRFEPKFHPHRLREPALLKKPARIFVCSMADLMGDWVPYEWIYRVRDVMWACPHHTFQLLTKNPGRYRDHWPENAWLGATVTDETSAFEAAYQMQRLEGTTFMSAEPLLGYITLPDCWTPDWIIIGPMTGQGATPPPDGAIQHLTDQAVAKGVPVFHKQACGEGFDRREWP
ncbi:MAG: DUF5131 family protein [Anaerolineae bacterium]|nr:DUF5131 family protein [Anaerolineae bacterium]